MPFTPIDKIITARFGQSYLTKKVAAVLVCEEFDRLILNIWGEKIKNQAQAVHLKGNILAVASLSNVVAQEIKLQEPRITRELNAKFGQSTVTGLQILT
jgi:hypothetical protein